MSRDQSAQTTGRPWSAPPAALTRGRQRRRSRSRGRDQWRCPGPRQPNL